ncbi:hypothetical protein TRAPUB_280, partial [Trametes pubescens]
NRQYQNDATFRKFRKELFHTLLRFILESLCDAMTRYEAVICADGHYRRIVFSIGPYIADYPEQALLSCVVQGWRPRCIAPPTDLDIGQAPRRSHQHTEALLGGLHPKRLWGGYGIVPELMPFTADFPRADIHELLSPDFLHQVTEGTFKDHLVTWVGAGHVPAQMVRALSAFRKFRYLVRRDAIDEDIFAAIDEALERFHRERVIFE